MKKENKKGRIIIAGFDSSFGRGITERLAQDGYDLLLLSRLTKSEDKIDFISRIKRKREGGVEVREFDVLGKENLSDERDVFGLVYCVSIPIGNKLFRDLDWEDYEGHILIQLKGVIKMVRDLIKTKSLKRIIVIGSSYTLASPPIRAADYVTAKYALWGWVKAAAVELAREGVTVNMISPGVSGQGVSANMNSLALEMEKRRTPMKRLVTSKEVASVVSFILSEEANYLTGLNMPVDGGISR